MMPFASNYRMKWAESRMKKGGEVWRMRFNLSGCGVFPAFKSLVALHDVYETGTAIGLGEVLVYFCFSTPILSFFRKFANNS